MQEDIKTIGRRVLKFRRKMTEVDNIIRELQEKQGMDKETAITEAMIQVFNPQLANMKDRKPF